MENLRIRSYRLLLYPDNSDHMKTFKIIKRQKPFSLNYAGIWHTSGKKHCHLLLRFPDPRSWHQLLKDISCDERFCRPVGYMVDSKRPDQWRRCSKKDNFEKACAYLPHFTDPEKEQYFVSDIFGSVGFVDIVRKNAIAYQSRQLSQAECLLAARSWICCNFGKVITPMMLVKWLTESPYMKIANSSLLRQMVEHHNYTVIREESRREGFDVDKAREAYEERLEAERQREREELVRALDAGLVDWEEPIF